MMRDEKLAECPHQETVFCYASEKKCERCGWNPEVSERRLQRIIEQRKNKKED